MLPAAPPAGLPLTHTGLCLPPRRARGARARRGPQRVHREDPGPGFPRSPEGSVEKPGRRKEDLRQCRREPQAGLAEVPRPRGRCCPGAAPKWPRALAQPDDITEVGAGPARHRGRGGGSGRLGRLLFPAGRWPQEDPALPASTIRPPGLSPRISARGSVRTRGSSAVCPARAQGHPRQVASPLSTGWSSRRNPPPSRTARPGQWRERPHRGRPSGCSRAANTL